MNNKLLVLGGALIINSLPAIAEHSSIDKIYHPYVQPMEHEIEWRMLAAEGEQTQLLSYGQSLSDRLFVEGYLTADQQSGNFRLASYELEARWQLTEQGEYWADWGVVTEIEKQHKQDSWEVASAIVAEKQWQRWVTTANLWLKYEWADHHQDQLEPALNLQLRYRYSQLFEPAIELYSSEDTQAIGPVMMGDVRFGGGKKLHWESGVIFGLNTKTPDTTLRLLAEFEF